MLTHRNGSKRNWKKHSGKDFTMKRLLRISRLLKMHAGNLKLILKASSRILTRMMSRLTKSLRLSSRQSINNGHQTGMTAIKESGGHISICLPVSFFRFRFTVTTSRIRTSGPAFVLIPQRRLCI